MDKKELKRRMSGWHLVHDHLCAMRGMTKCGGGESMPYRDAYEFRFHWDIDIIIANFI